MQNQQESEPQQLQEQNQPEEVLDLAENPKPPEAGQSRWHHLRSWYLSHKKISIPATAALLLLIVFATPWTRYATTGLVIKKDLSLRIIDSSSNTPVSGATVKVGSISGITDGNGKVVLHSVKVGNHSVIIVKKYYQDKTVNVLVPILKEQKVGSVDFEAIGRPVKIVVGNTITGDKLSGVQIKLADIEAKTDNKGSATVVVPAGTEKQEATLSLEGYNETVVEVKIGNGAIEENKFKLTPAGKIYFLSKRTGNLDIMKVNLDGTEPELVIGGTGNEQDSNTILMPSSDGQHVALLAKRTKTEVAPQLYVFATSDEKILQADSGNADFNLIGWSGSKLVYSTSRKDLPSSQLGKGKLKSYDAGSGKMTLLDQTEASDPVLSASQTYSLTVLAGDSVVFGKSWSSSNGAVLGGKRHSLNTIDSGGQNYKTAASYDPANFIQYSRHSPVAFYIWERPAGGRGRRYFLRLYYWLIA